jgi:exodeoxyribonuclease VII large subunit
MATGFDDAEPAGMRPALTVSALNRAVSGLLERSFPLVRVRGEVCNLNRAASGHWYFGLKDDSAQVRCVMFRSRAYLLNWVPRDGDEVEIQAIVSLYEARGEFQLNVESMARAGLGRLYEEFLRLKERLAAEGLFDAARKRALPRVPRALGIVTSLQAAALTDVVTTLARRAPYVRVIVYPVPVQGSGAAALIAETLAEVSTRDEVDVVLLVRGGGSIEDLWSFNDEAVARAIRACALPVIVGVGHESDVTIADFAADVRAPTPTAAAEQAAPAANALSQAFAALRDRLRRPLLHRLEVASQRLDYTQRALSMPRAPIAALEMRIAGLQGRAVAVTARRLPAARARLEALVTRLRARLSSARIERVRRLSALLRAAMVERVRCVGSRNGSLAARLHALNPEAVLLRGYSLVVGPGGRIVTDSRQLDVGQTVRLKFAEGDAEARVQAVHRESDG